MYTHKLYWLFIYCIGCLGTRFVYSQNLVPNPSFENLKTAPSCDNPLSKDAFEAYIYDWSLPTDGSADIHSTLLPNSCILSQPNSTAFFPEFPTGHQVPRTGNNFAGFAPYISQWYREYISVKLTQALVPGQRYCCRMYMSLAENCSYTQNNIGMYFSNTLVYQPNAAYLTMTPQVVMEDAVDDSINWVEFKRSFIATSAAQYLIIGNFDVNAGQGQSFIGNKNASFAYYYIDDVSVEALNPPPAIITGNQKVCPGAFLQVTANGWENMFWTNSHNEVVSTSNVLNINNTQQETYIVKGYQCNTLLSQDVPIEVHPIPAVNLGPDNYICKNGTLELDAGAGYSSYQWQDGSTAQTFTAQSNGDFNVLVSNSQGCYNSDVIHLDYYQDPTASIGEDFETCTPSGILDASNQLDYETFLWNTGNTTAQLEYTQEGTYFVSVSNPCGLVAHDTITIYNIDFFIPNLITPNNDELNDQFEVQGLKISSGSLEIYNSFGAQVYKNSYYDNSWSGTNLSEGIYFYVFKYPTCTDRKGWIQIIK